MYTLKVLIFTKTNFREFREFEKKSEIHENKFSRNFQKFAFSRNSQKFVLAKPLQNKLIEKFAIIT